VREPHPLFWWATHRTLLAAAAACHASVKKPMPSSPAHGTQHRQRDASVVFVCFILCLAQSLPAACVNSI
jgi:hypothetical protein